jgi:hypothetical protein
MPILSIELLKDIQIILALCILIRFHYYYLHFSDFLLF